MKVRHLPAITIRQWVVGQIKIRTIMPPMTIQVG
jgi:hypothetical protein